MKIGRGNGNGEKGKEIEGKREESLRGKVKEKGGNEENSVEK